MNSLNNPIVNGNNAINLNNPSNTTFNNHQISPVHSPTFDSQGVNMISGMNNVTANESMIHNLTEHIMFMKNELEEYKMQNKIVYSDLEKSLNNKCAISQLQDVHSKLLNEIHTKIQAGQGAHNNVSKEFLDDIMKKLNDVKTADLLKQDRIAQKNKESYIKDYQQKLGKNKINDYKWNGKDTKPIPRPKQTNTVNGRDQSN